VVAFDYAEDGGLMLVNQEFMAHQRQIIWDFMGQVGKNIFSGSLFKISMPVGLCEPRSFLERLCDQWAYVPEYLNKAAECKEPEERLKWVVAGMVGGLHPTVRMDKPFNPILGETFQGVYKDGSQVFLEQISHHPPISCWEIMSADQGASWKVSGYGESVAKFFTNSMVVGMNACNCVEFADGTKIRFKMPRFSIGGVVMGTRVVEYFGTWVFYDETNKLICNLTFTDNSKNKGGLFSSKKIVHPSDYFEGFIVKGTAQFNEESGTDDIVVDMQYNEADIISVAKGSWIDYVEFDGVELWRRGTTGTAELPKAPRNLLLSDSRFRTDAQAVASLDWEFAEKEKLRLEEAQRKDRKLRAKFDPSSEE